MPMNDQWAIRFCGWAGLSGAAMLLASDWLMMGTFTDARSFMDNWLTILAEMPAWRVLLGAIAGPLGAWLYIVGFWQLYLALKPAGRRLAFVCWAGFSIGFVYVAGAFHTSFPFMAHAAQSMEAGELGGPEQLMALANPTINYAIMLFVAGALPSLVGCLILAYAVLALPTRYPRWTVVFNPIVLYVITLAFRFAPAPLGGLLYIGYGNIVFLTFFAASTAVLWHSGETHGQKSK
jgi:hypothetical protein